MKPALIMAIVFAIATVVVAFVFAMKLRVAQSRLKSGEKQLNELKSRLARAEAFGQENSQAKTAMTDNYETIRKKYERLRRLAYYDAGTDLPNRLKLTESFEAAKKKCAEGEEIGLAIFAFRSESDAGLSFLGRNNTEMKQEILQRLRGALNSEDDEIALLGDDAFAVLTQRIVHRVDYESKIDKLFKLLALPMMNNGVETEPIVYGAVTVAPEDGNTMQILDMNLGLAMAEAVKQSAEQGECRYCFYTEEIAKNAIDRMGIQAAVTDAVRAGAVEYPLIPRKMLSGGAIEQLAVSPILRTQEGVVGGDTLFGYIDQSGQAMVVYEAMLVRAGEFLHRFAEMGITDVRIAVPVSERMFNNREFIKTTYDALQNQEPDMRRVTFELPEQVVMRNLRRSKEIMRKLEAFGVCFTLDTEGLPIVPAKELAEMPVVYWRAQSIAVPEPGDEETAKLLSAVAQTAHQFGAKLICAGMNTREQETLAKECGLDIAQGALYGEAMGAELVGHLMTALRNES
ncbi:MAG: EAL domain-containing protein [Lachnospiraceae bacterium]|nr:EAL domain-containing protein [Lachnospiraceae bacterium]